MIKGNKPLLGRWLGQRGIIFSDYAMQALPLRQGQVREREVAHLGMDRIHAPIKLHEGRLHQLIACLAPVLHQIKRHNFLRHQFQLVSMLMTVLLLLFAHQTQRRMHICQHFRGHQHRDLLVAER